MLAPQRSLLVSQTLASFSFVVRRVPQICQGKRREKKPQKNAQRTLPQFDLGTRGRGHELQLTTGHMHLPTRRRRVAHITVCGSDFRRQARPDGRRKHGVGRRRAVRLSVPPGSAAAAAMASGAAQGRCRLLLASTRGQAVRVEQVRLCLLFRILLRHSHTVSFKLYRNLQRERERERERERDRGFASRRGMLRLWLQHRVPLDDAAVCSSRRRVGTPSVLNRYASASSSESRCAVQIPLTIT
jgi:hypothetical protein